MKMLREVKWLRHATDKSCTTPLPDFYLLLTYTDTLSNKTPMSTTPRFFSISDFRTIWREIEKNNKKTLK